MSKYSDHNKPQTSIFDLLPEVFRSDVNQSVFNTAFDRHLTKDDTSRVTGFIGEPNTNAVVDRRIKEETPHRQAFQLAPTMVSTTGTETSALSQNAFLRQLELMGVDRNRLPMWGNTLQFNWVPPINIDMLVNFQDYFWRPDDPTSRAQYLTIENGCNKAKSKVDSYKNMVTQRGATFAVQSIDYLNSELVVSLKYDDLFAPGFIFYTKDSSNANMQDKWWTVVTSSYDSTTHQTSIEVMSTTTSAPLIAVGTTYPVSAALGEWFYNTSEVAPLHQWNGTTWEAISQSITLNISLTERLAVFQAQANCACDGDLGWDIANLDDNNWGTYTTASTPPPHAIGIQWFDTTLDELKISDGSVWNLVSPNFSEMTSSAFWDSNTSCEPQTYNQWSRQNQWIHKSEITSTSGAQRAQLPILEYDSTVELNEWVRATYAWKYRATVDQPFEYITTGPSRLELEPVKGYYAEYDGSQWIVYLFHKLSTTCRDVDYSDTFAPGFKFRIVNDTLTANIYTVKTVEYREMTAAYIASSINPVNLQANVGSDVMCTIITLEESLFVSPAVAYGQPTDPLNTRIEPIVTATGDAWKGYHAHWVLDDENVTFTPVTHQRWNYYRQISFANTTALTPGSIPEFPANFASGVYGVTHQEYTVGNTSTQEVQLHPSLQYSTTAPQMFATPDSNEIRVYVNDVRQYGTYTEQTAFGSPNYTIVGQVAYTAQQIEYVTGITFNQALNLFDVVRIEVGPAPFNCMGSNAIPVRTIEDETEFTLAAAAGTQPAYRSMTQCYNLEQSKTTLNQYPLFNVYDVATSAVIAANSIFSYKEDPAATINTAIQRRIAASADGKEFTFEQHLRDAVVDNIYAYKTFRQTTSYWYSPLLNKAYNWNGYAWSDRVVVDTTTGPAVRRIIVSATQPTTVLPESIWMNTISLELYQYTGGTWVLNTTDITVNATDPLLRTIWRHGLNNEQYVPAYVDASLNEVPVGSLAGDWEVVDQWMYNSEHKNNKEISYAQLVTHLRSIINSQPQIPGLQTGGVFTLTQDEYNYALGGTIKEHNDSFDTLISAVNVSNVTPIGVIEFASQEYASSILRIRDIFNKSAVEYLTDYSKDTFADFTGKISNSVIAAYENNDYAAQLYGDTSAYNVATGVGVQNWIASIPMFNLGSKHVPFISIVGDSVYVSHHDGHRSTISYTSAEFDRLARSTCNTPDNRVPGSTLGITRSTDPTVACTTSTDFVSNYGSALRTGVYWYQVGATRKLYRLQAYDISFTAPSYYDLTGAEIPDGTTYYDKGFEVVFVKSGLSWIQHPDSTSVGDISPLWMEVSFAAILGEIILDIEQHLYAVSPASGLVFDYTSLQSEPTVFDALKEQRFYDYVSAHGVVAPLVNTDYDITNAFTWNYAQSIIVTFPSTALTSYAAASWQELYTRVYGTPYPHLEPWILQGYADKPTWWDATYADDTGTRRWKATMWTDILGGPGQPTYASVNTANDTLLPPYSSTHTTAPNRSLFTPTDGTIISPGADYAFGGGGPTEWQWTTSFQYPYDLPVIAFQMQPAKFLHAAFGPTYTSVDELQVDTLFKRVYSHEGAMFHGDVYNNTDQYLVHGINQWYVNYNRYSGFDTNAEFRELWVGWNPRMTYQFGGIADTSSFDIASKYFDVSTQDYNIVLVDSGVIEDVWADAFEIQLITIPPAVVQYNNQALWKMEIDSLAAISRNISYYGVRHYETTVDTATDTFSIGVNMPWVTGDVVVMSASKFLPAPLKPDTGYYIIRVSSNTFKLAETPQLAAALVAIDVTSPGDGVMHVSQVESSFNVFGGYGNTTDLWFHYAVDRNDVRTFMPPQTITGMQNLINLLDGYAVFQADAGVQNKGTEANDFDPVTGRLVDWNLETERFIDWAYGLRQSRVRVSDKHEVSVNTTTSQFTFTSMTPTWLSGTTVAVSSTGALPSPLIAGAPYYVVSTGTLGTFRLSLSANPTDTSAYVTLATPGSGQVYVGLYDTNRVYPRFEVNPYRNNVWIDTPLGMLSNVIEGPYTDIRVQQTIFDQYSRPITPDQLTVYRQDLRSHIAIRPAMTNDVDQIYTDDPYNYIHIGGGHFFIEGYEHFLLFNDYTSGGALVYDQFLGLWSKRFTLDYFEKTDYTLRPTLGGYYLIDGQFERNMEGSIDDMRAYYDAHIRSGSTDVTKRSRDLLGFSGPATFMDLLNVNDTSQFAFYRGMIQAKGSINSVKAYINSRRFVDAKVDEFWAWKIAEFGDSRRRVYPEVNLFATDTIVDDVRLEFLARSEQDTDPDVVDSVSKGFKIVSYSTPERWNMFPEQKAEIGSPLFLDAEVSSVTVIYANTTAKPPLPVHGSVDYWYHTDTQVLTMSDGSPAPADTLVFQTVILDGMPMGVLYFHHGNTCDDVRVIRKIVDDVIITGDYTPFDYTTDTMEQGLGGNAYIKVNSEVVRIHEADINTGNVDRPTILSIYTLNPAKSKISPAKLVDKKTGAVVQQVPVWHPAKGHHSHVAIHNVDLQVASDPARYNVTLNPDLSASNNWEENFWNQTEVGTIWVDTSYLGYMPYYDDKVTPNTNDRLHTWGNMAPWGDVKVCEWVKSTVVPQEWVGSGVPHPSTFYRTRSSAVPATFDIANTVTITAAGYAVGDVVVFVADTGTPPDEVTSNKQYTLSGTAPNFNLTDTLSGEAVSTITSNGDTGVQVIKAFAVEDWIEHKLIHDHLTVPNLLDNLAYGTVDYSAPVTTSIVKWIPADASAWYVNGNFPTTTVDVYKNGVLVTAGLTVSSTHSTLPALPTLPMFSVTLPASMQVNEHDLIDIVRPIHVITTEESSFDPDLDDDGTQMINWKIDYHYSANTLLTNPTNVNDTASTPYYYFWVEQSTTRLDGTAKMSTQAISTQLRTIPTPYFIVQRPKDAPILLDRYGYDVPPYDTAFSLGDIAEDTYLVPVLYREAVIRGVSKYITDNERHSVRFTCDHALRDTLTSSIPMLKNKHQEWMLFRKAQMSTVPRALWDRLTEALVGYKLADHNIRVPALERELYDASYETDTQYGLGVDQTFVDKTLGLATIIAYLTDPTHDFSPMDINAFFAMYSFDTPANIEIAMNVIYTSFSSEHVNAIWFDVLDDSLSLRAKYKELMKTSWIALHGIRVLEVGGLFDD